MRYAVYDIVSGDILRICTATSWASAVKEANETDGVIECGYDVSDLTHRIEDGQIVEKQT